jgi:hypothetical protein
MQESRRTVAAFLKIRSEDRWNEDELKKLTFEFLSPWAYFMRNFIYNGE